MHHDHDINPRPAWYRSTEVTPLLPAQLYARVAEQTKDSAQAARRSRRRWQLRGKRAAPPLAPEVCRCSRHWAVATRAQPKRSAGKCAAADASPYALAGPCMHLCVHATAFLEGLVVSFSLTTNLVQVEVVRHC